VELTADQQQLVDLATRVPAADIPTAKRVLEALIGDQFGELSKSAPHDDEEVTYVAFKAISDDVKIFLAHRCP
jgi:hypothetical protein